MGEFTPRPDLDLLVARMIAPELNRIAHEVVLPTAKRLAPGTKTWQSVGDEHVRKTHVEAHGQTVAENARFKLTAYQWDLEHPGAIGAPFKVGDGSGWDGPDAATVPGVYSYFLEPRDQTAGAYVNAVNCRCFIVRNPDGISEHVEVDEAVPTTTHLVARVYVESNEVKDAEYGDLYPFPVSEPAAKGSMFMHRAAVEAANVLRARQ